jgi:hypothetical protein
MFGSYLSVGGVGKRKRITEGYSERPDKGDEGGFTPQARELRLYQISP